MKKTVFWCLALAMCVGMNIHAQNSGGANFGSYPADYGIAYFDMLGYSKLPTVRNLFGNNAPFLTKIQSLPIVVTLESGTGSGNKFTAVVSLSIKNEQTGESIKAMTMQVEFESDSLAQKSYVRYVKFVQANGVVAGEKRSYGTPEADGEALGVFEGIGMQFFWDKSQLK